MSLSTAYKTYGQSSSPIARTMLLELQWQPGMKIKRRTIAVSLDCQGNARATVTISRGRQTGCLHRESYSGLGNGRTHSTCLVPRLRNPTRHLDWIHQMPCIVRHMSIPCHGTTLIPLFTLSEGCELGVHLSDEAGATFPLCS